MVSSGSQVEWYDRINALSGHWPIISEYYKPGFPTMVNGQSARMINYLLEIGALNSDLKFTSKFCEAVTEVAEGRHIGEFDVPDITEVVNRYFY